MLLEVIEKESPVLRQVMLLKILNWKRKPVIDADESGGPCEDHPLPLADCRFSPQSRIFLPPQSFAGRNTLKSPEK
jgi:hypothetical protein